MQVTAARAAVMRRRRAAACVGGARMGFPVRKVCGHDGLLPVQNGAGDRGRHRQVRRVLSGAKDAHGIGLFAALIVPMGNPGEVAWSAAAPCR